MVDFTRNFGVQPEPQPEPQPRMVYQDARNTSSHWRNDIRMWHPLTENQFGNNFRVGDRVKMRLLYDNNDKMYLNLTIVNIIGYQITKQVLGSYNEGDAFKGSPFTHVLVLE
jgi:hypothetical protein